MSALNVLTVVISGVSILISVRSIMWSRKAQKIRKAAEAAVDDAMRTFNGLDMDKCYISGCQCGKPAPMMSDRRDELAAMTAEAAADDAYRTVNGFVNTRREDDE